MTKVIDHIIIELEMDPTKFTAGQKKAAQAFLNIATGAEEAGKKVQQPLDNMGKILDGLGQKITSLTAGFLSFETVRKGVDLAQRLTETNVALGNLSRVTGISVRELSLLEGTAERAGGSGKKMLASIAGVQRQLQDYSIGGGLAKIQTVIAALTKAGAHIDNTPSRLQEIKATGLIRELVGWMEKLNVPHDNRVQFLRNIGMDDDSIAVFDRGLANFDKMYEAQKNILQITEDDIQAAYDLNAAWKELTQTGTALGYAIMTYMAEPLIKVMKTLSGVDSRQKARDDIQTKEGPYWDALRSRLGIQKQDKPGGYVPPKAPPSPSSSSPAPGGRYKVDTGNPSTTAPAGVGMTQQQWDAYRQAIANRESSGGNYSLKGGAGNMYDGAYQMGQDARSDAAKSLREMPVSRERFRGDPSMQERYMAEFTRQNHQALMKNPRYAALSFEEKMKILAYAHNQGAGGAAEYLRTGVAKRDGFGTLGTAFSGDVGAALKNTAPAAIPWMSNPKLLRAPRYNQQGTATTNDYSTAETVVHSMIFNDNKKPITDDAYGLATDAVPTLDNKMQVIRSTEGPN
ncbi:MAG: hypothetical protein JSS57_07365 [Proteobacteria bacterium]|nr:hypothetical protein [Pseudomonadota bacterium]